MLQWYIVLFFAPPEYCEGFIEVINTVEERIELESRLKVYEEMLANMRAEVSTYYLLLGLLGIFNWIEFFKAKQC